MNEAQKAAEALMVAQLKTLPDSEFLGFVATLVASADGPMSSYLSNRLNLIAVRVEAASMGGDAR